MFLPLDKLDKTFAASQPAPVTVASVTPLQTPLWKSKVSAHMALRTDWCQPLLRHAHCGAHGARSQLGPREHLSNWLRTQTSSRFWVCLDGVQTLLHRMRMPQTGFPHLAPTSKGRVSRLLEPPLA